MQLAARSALVAMDLHAHLSRQPVYGILGGTFDEATATLSVSAASMVKEASRASGPTATTREGVRGGGRGGDAEPLPGCATIGMDVADGVQAALRLRARGLYCVGQYLSRPPPSSCSKTGSPLQDFPVSSTAAAAPGSEPTAPDPERPLGPDFDALAAFQANVAATGLGLPGGCGPFVAALLHPYRRTEEGTGSGRQSIVLPSFEGPSIITPATLRPSETSTAAFH